MNNYFYSPQNNMFYPVELMDVYKAAGTWPEDAFSIDYAVYEAFVINEPPLGKNAPLVLTVIHVGLIAWL